MPDLTSNPATKAESPKSDPPKDFAQPPKGGDPGSTKAETRSEPTQAELINATLARFTKNLPSSVPVGPSEGLDTTIKGGKYIVRGRLVDAHDREINEDGTLKYPEAQSVDAFGRLI